MLRNKPCKHINAIKEKPLLIVASVIFGISFVARLYIAGQSAAENVELKNLFANRLQLQQEVTRLRYDDLRLSSIAVVEERAIQAGFVPMKGFLLSLDINASQPIASR